MQYAKSNDMNDQLTKREKEILELISNEFTIDEIASELFISPLTVMTHRRNMMQKMQVRNMVGLVRVGYEEGLLQLKNTQSRAVSYK